MKKTIPLSQLKPGMFMIGMDQSWWKTPFLRHHRFIKNAAEIEILRQSGVREVTIDPSRSGCEDEPTDQDHELSSMGKEEPAQLLSCESSLEQGDSEDTGRSNREEVDSKAGRDEPRAHGSIEENRVAVYGNGNGQGEDLQGLKHIDSREREHLSFSTPAIEAAREIHDTAVLVVEQMFEGVATGVPINNAPLAQAVDGILHNLVADHRTLPQLVLVQNLGAVDKTLYTHVVDVCVLACMVGIEMEMEPESLTHLATGALLHDIGYLRLPRNVVRRRGDQQGQTSQALLQKHSELGKLILGHTADVSEEVQRIVHEHHERQDGSGTPQGLHGEAIGPLSQVVGVVDAFDNLVSSWGRWPVVPPGMALREIYKNAQAGLFLLEIVNHLIRCLGVYPLGSAVSLSTGERGVVSKVNPENTLKPAMVLIADGQGLPYPEPLHVDLANPSTGDPERAIERLLDPFKEKIQVGDYLKAAGWCGN